MHAFISQTKWNEQDTSQNKGLDRQWSRRSVHGFKICKTKRLSVTALVKAIRSFQCGWNSKQERNDNTLSGTTHSHRRSDSKNSVFNYWTRKTEDHTWIP